MDFDHLHPDKYEDFEEYIHDLRNVKFSLLNESQKRDLCIYMVQNCDEESLSKVSDALWNEVLAKI